MSRNLRKLTKIGMESGHIFQYNSLSCKHFSLRVKCPTTGFTASWCKSDIAFFLRASRWWNYQNSILLRHSTSPTLTVEFSNVKSASSLQYWNDKTQKCGMLRGWKCEEKLRQTLSRHSLVDLVYHRFNQLSPKLFIPQ